MKQINTFTQTCSRDSAQWVSSGREGEKKRGEKTQERGKENQCL